MSRRLGRFRTNRILGLPQLLADRRQEALELRFSRIQFTPDLMPSDITGTEIIEGWCGPRSIWLGSPGQA